MVQVRVICVTAIKQSLGAVPKLDESAFEGEIPIVFRLVVISIVLYIPN